MIGQTIRASRSTLFRLARQQATGTFTRTFIVPTSARRADFVQDLYLKELRAHKPQPLKPNDSEGHVHKFSMPQTPKSPEETDIANELQAYEKSVVEVEGQRGGAEGANAAVEEDWFVEEDEEEGGAHH